MYEEPCAICRGLGTGRIFGEGFPWRGVEGGPEPPEAARLEPLRNRKWAAMRYIDEWLYRCPSCGNWYEYRRSVDSFYGNTDYWLEVIERLTPSEALKRLTSEKAEAETSAMERAAPAIVERLLADLHDSDDDVRELAEKMLMREFRTIEQLKTADQLPPLDVMEDRVRQHWLRR
jgi:hypothetical protein